MMFIVLVTFHIGLKAFERKASVAWISVTKEILLQFK